MGPYKRTQTAALRRRLRLPQYTSSSARDSLPRVLRLPQYTAPAVVHCALCTAATSTLIYSGTLIIAAMTAAVDKRLFLSLVYCGSYTAVPQYMRRCGTAACRGG